MSLDVVFDTLHSITEIASAGSTIIFDYLDTVAFDPEKAPVRVQKMQAAAQMSGEPMKAGFNPSTLAADLESLGLHLHENLSPSEIEKRFFYGRTDAYHAFDNLHFARIVK